MTIVMWIRVHPYKATYFVITSTSTCSANTTFWCPSLERIVDSLFNVQFISFTMSLPQSPRLWKFTRCLCIWSFRPILQNKYHTDLLELHFCSINMTNVSCWQGLYVYIVSKLLRSLYRTRKCRNFSALQLEIHPMTDQPFCALILRLRKTDTAPNIMPGSQLFITNLGSNEWTSQPYSAIASSNDQSLLMLKQWPGSTIHSQSHCALHFTFYAKLKIFDCNVIGSTKSKHNNN